jgi:hypothetical protein
MVEMSVRLDDGMDGRIQGKPTKWTDLSPTHNAHVCVFDDTYHKMMLNDIGVAVTLFILNKKSSMNPFLPVHLIIHITKLDLPITFPKPLYIRHFACIHRDPGH